MNIFKRIKDVASGRIAKSNSLIGNHGMRINEKLKKYQNPLFEAIVMGTAICTMEFLDSVLFDVQDFKHQDGTTYPNPFRANSDLLDRYNSYEMFKLVVGGYLALLFSGQYLDSIKDMVDTSQLKNDFFHIYEYNDADKITFDELFALAQKDERPSMEMCIYDNIFKRAYKIMPPESAYHMMNFEFLLRNSFYKIFLPGLVKALEDSPKKK